MGTRTNFYKNPSISYKKDLNLSSALQNLRAYNIAIGSAPLIEEQTPPVLKKSEKRKRHHELELSCDPKYDRWDGDRAMSHQDYIQRRREEVSAPQPYETLTEDVLGTSSSGLNLVEYESDESTSSESAVKQDHQDTSVSHQFEEVKSRNEQRFADAGEPVCVLCGRYGEYICNETDDDICSMECKLKLLEILKHNENEKSSSSVVKDELSKTKGILPSPVFGEDTWDYKNHHWSKKKSTLCTYECWKCERPGHLAEDCLVKTSNQAMGQKKSSCIPGDLLAVYKRCYQIGKNLSTASCNECSNSFSLATCLDCSTVYCDSAGHLNEHIKARPTHGLYYSHKLKRLVKCCKSTCKETDIKDLLVCHYCFDKAFDKFYDMYTATWKGAGLSIIWGSICCEDHFTWHRMNCFNADVEDSGYIISRNAQKDESISISDFIF